MRIEILSKLPEKITQGDEVRDKVSLQTQVHLVWGSKGFYWPNTATVLRCLGWAQKCYMWREWTLDTGYSWDKDNPT